MTISSWQLEESVRVPDARVRAIYAVKAAAMGVLVGFILLVEEVFFPSLPGRHYSWVAFAAILPNVVVAVSRGPLSWPLIYLCFALDAVAITVGIHVGGGVDSTSGPTLYAVLIILAGMVLTSRAAYVVCAGCAALYGSMVLAERMRWIEHTVDYEKSTGDAIATVVVVSLHLTLVAWLVSYAARQIRALFLHVEELRGETLGARSVTILYSDIEGYTSMTERLGDQNAHHVIETHNRIVREQLRAHDGDEVELQGDAFVLAFASPQQAVRCACAIQESFRRHNQANPQERVRVRIGLHTGAALRSGDHFFGQTVVAATHIAGLASGGEIVASASVRDLAGPDCGVEFAPAETIHFDDTGQTWTVHRLRWTAAGQGEAAAGGELLPALQES